MSRLDVVDSYVERLPYTPHAMLDELPLGLVTRLSPSALVAHAAQGDGAQPLLGLAEAPIFHGRLRRWPRTAHPPDAVASSRCSCRWTWTGPRPRPPYRPSRA